MAQNPDKLGPNQTGAEALTPVLLQFPRARCVFQTEIVYTNPAGQKFLVQVRGVDEDAVMRFAATFRFAAEVHSGIAPLAQGAVGGARDKGTRPHPEPSPEDLVIIVDPFDLYGLTPPYTLRLHALGRFGQGTYHDYLVPQADSTGVVVTALANRTYAEMFKGTQILRDDQVADETTVDVNGPKRSDSLSGPVGVAAVRVIDLQPGSAYDLSGDYVVPK